MRWLGLLVLLGCTEPTGVHCRRLADSLIVTNPPTAVVIVEVC